MFEVIVLGSSVGVVRPNLPFILQSTQHTFGGVPNCTCGAGRPCCPPGLVRLHEPRLSPLLVSHCVTQKNSRALLESVRQGSPSFSLLLRPRSLYFLGCVTHTWLVWFVVVWSPSLPPGGAPRNPVFPWGLGLGLHVGAGALCEPG